MLFASNCCHFEVKYTTIHWSIHCIQLRGVREQKQFPEPSRPQQSTSPHFSIVLHSLAITVHHCYTALLHSLAITALLHCYRVLANWKFSIFQTNHPSISIFYSLSILLCLLLIDFFQAEVLCQVKVPSPSQTILRKSEYLFQGRDQYQTLSLKQRVQWSAVNKEKVQPSSLKPQKGFTEVTQVVPSGERTRQDACWTKRGPSPADLVPEGDLGLPKRHHHRHVHLVEGEDEDHDSDEGGIYFLGGEDDVDVTDDWWGQWKSCRD